MANFTLRIARRYLFSKGNRNVINIISGIAALGVAIGCLAMIVVLSAFNGLEELVSDIYTAVDPDIRVSLVRGKTAPIDSFQISEVATWDEIQLATPVIEETVFLQFDHQQRITTLKGIDPAYLELLKWDEYVQSGTLSFDVQGMDAAVVGYGVADMLNLLYDQSSMPIKVYAANRSHISSTLSEDKFVSDRLIPASIVAVNPEFDFKYIFTSLPFASRLFDYDSRCSYVDVLLKPGVDAEQIKRRLEAKLGLEYQVKTRIELNDVLYKTNASEKWVTFFILCFILIVATFNLIGSISMLIIEKRQDIALLRALGSNVSHIQRLFLSEGLLINGIGGLVGILGGITLVLVQQYIGFFPLQGGLVEYYPVKLEWLDVTMVCLVTLVIGLIASWIPVRVLLSARKLQAGTNS